MDFVVFKLVNLLFHQILIQNKVFVFKETAKFEGLIYYFTKKLFENVLKHKKVNKLCKKSEKEFEELFKNKQITLKEVLHNYFYVGNKKKV